MPRAQSESARRPPSCLAERRVTWRLAALLALSLGACGARTDLEITSTEREAGMDAGPDAGRDAGRDTGPPPACVPGTVALTPVRAEVLFVLDRSTSMGWGLEGPDGPPPTRWTILLGALREQLPTYEADSDLGLLLFPDPAAAATSCSASPAPQIEPRPGASAAILSVMEGTRPEGRTPTADAMRAARTFFLARPDRSKVRAVVLPTDGAPNCNADLDTRTCPCTGGAGLPRGCTTAELCLDDARTIETIRLLAEEGIPTYVIGIDGDPDPAVSRVLTELALAGGEPNPDDPAQGYYAVDRPSDLAAAFDSIQEEIVDCSVALDRPVPLDAGLELTIDGRRVENDPTRTEGWEWSATTDETIVLHGDACRRVSDGTEHSIELHVMCPPEP